VRTDIQDVKLSQIRVAQFHGACPLTEWVTSDEALGFQVSSLPGEQNDLIQPAVSALGKSRVKDRAHRFLRVVGTCVELATDRPETLLQYPPQEQRISYQIPAPQPARLDQQAPKPL